MTRLPKAYARELRASAAVKLGNLIDILEPGRTPPEVPSIHRTFVALDGALKSSPRWARHVSVPATPQALAQVGALSAHLQCVAR